MGQVRVRVSARASVRASVHDTVLAVDGLEVVAAAGLYGQVWMRVEGHDRSMKS